MGFCVKPIKKIENFLFGKIFNKTQQKNVIKYSKVLLLSSLIKYL